MKKGLLLLNFDFQVLIFLNLKIIFVNDIYQEGKLMIIIDIEIEMTH